MNIDVFRRADHASALLLFLAILLAGCRDHEPQFTPSGPSLPAIHFSPGQTFTYEGWTLDTYGYVIPDSRTSDVWKIATMGVALYGRDSVTVVLDSIAAGARAGNVDTLFLQTRPDGNLYEYGFLSRIILNKNGTLIPRSWDLVCMASAGINDAWTVGTIDQEGKVSVSAVYSGDEEYVTAGVNGTPEVFPARRVNFFGPSFDYSVWLSATPSAFTRFLREPSDTTNGSLNNLVDIRLLKQ